MIYANGLIDRSIRLINQFNKGENIDFEALKMAIKIAYVPAPDYEYVALWNDTVSTLSPEQIKEIYVTLIEVGSWWAWDEIRSGAFGGPISILPDDKFLEILDAALTVKEQKWSPRQIWDEMAPGQRTALETLATCLMHWKKSAGFIVRPDTRGAGDFIGFYKGRDENDRGELLAIVAKDWIFSESTGHDPVKEARSVCIDKIDEQIEHMLREISDPRSFWGYTQDHLYAATQWKPDLIDTMDVFAGSARRHLQLVRG